VRRIGVVITALGLLAALGCAKKNTAARAPLSERQRDSVLARSGLPGSDVVGRAMQVSDRAAVRAEKMDAADSLFH
jgi:hypothetical protein